MSTDVVALFRNWEEWASNADKAENGWQSNFSNWDSLMDAARYVMTLRRTSVAQIRTVERCWAISEETEDLADYAREHIGDCWAMLTRLAGSSDPSVRWQVYDVLGRGGRDAEPLLRKGLDDADQYARRRAILALARLRPADAKQIAEQLIADADPYIRQTAIEMACASGDAAFIGIVSMRLRGDPSHLVRQAAAESDER